MTKTSLHKLRIPSLGTQIFIGFAVGIILGLIFYKNEVAITTLNNIGTIFLEFLQMIVLPIIITCLTLGVAKMGDMKKIGRVGGKTLLYFEIMSFVAIIFGLIIANVFHPGTFIDIKNIQPIDISKYSTSAQKSQSEGFWGFIMNLVPVNIFSALSKGDILPTIVFSIFLGLGIAAIGKKGEVLIKVFDAGADVMFKITSWVVKLSPIGVCALVGATLAELGIAALIPLGYFVALVYIAMVVFILIGLGAVCYFCRIKLFDLLKTVKEELILAFTTSSSESVLPRQMKKMEHFGVNRSIVSFVTPIGYTFNLDGSTLYQSMAALFIAQAYHINLSIGQQLMLILILMITSKGIAGVPGASLVVLIATVGSVGIPVQGVALIAGVDRFLDMGRTAVNVIGNAVAAVVIGESEHEFNWDKSEKYIAKLNER